MLTRNKELFYKVADIIEQMPDRYYQGYFGEEVDCDNYALECDSSHCIAGWVAVILGYHPTVVYEEKPFKDYYTWSMVSENENSSPYSMGAISPWDLAIESLGLTQEEAVIVLEYDWEPKNDMTVPQALRHFGNGGKIE